MIIPALLPPAVQSSLLTKLMHRDLSDPRHKTNIHMHYDVPYSPSSSTSKIGDSDGQKPSTENGISPENTSFFAYPPTSPTLFLPKDPTVHKPLDINQVMQKKLRWTTLGGQYDWTRKIYPEEQPPAFPEDLADLIEGLFPEMKAQAAIVNLYSPGDTLSLHRDVSEECDRGLVSVSLGCDCIFVIGLAAETSGEATSRTTRESRCVVVRLRSGDAVYMSKEARFAWHGVPKIIPDTCPAFLRDWPANASGDYEAWRGWMNRKRINLNVRQMRD